MKRFKNILFYADGTNETDHALERAFLLADNNHARLTLLDVIEPIDIPRDVSERFEFDLQVQNTKASILAVKPVGFVSPVK
jgi:nucleotide-binding universal stress UspA family protein